MRDFNYLITTLIYGLIVFPTYSDPTVVSMMKESTYGGWQAFGFGVMHWQVKPKNREIYIDIGWHGANWGIGGSYVLDKPIDGKSLHAIRLKVKTFGGTKTSVYAGLATKDGANLIIDSEKALPVTKTWQTISIPLFNLKPYKPDAASIAFTAEDWNHIEIIKILFTKPENSQYLDEKIVIRDPVLIFKHNFGSSD